MSWSFDPIIHFRRWLVLPFWVTVGSDDWFEVIFRHDVISRRLFVIVSLQHAFFLTNLHIKSSSCWHFCTMTRHFTSHSTSRDVFFKTNFAMSHPSVDFCTTTRHFTSYSTSRDDFLKTNFALSRPPVDDFCATTSHFVSNSTSRDVFFKTNLHIKSSSFLYDDPSLYVSFDVTRRLFLDKFAQWVGLLLTIFAWRLVTLHLIRRQKTNFLEKFAH